MSDKKYIPQTKDIRCKVEFTDGKTRLTLQKLKWYGWADTQYTVDILVSSEIAKNTSSGKDMYKRNPQILNYQGCGQLEIYQYGTFDLQKRATELGEERQKSVDYVRLQRSAFDAFNP